MINATEVDRLKKGAEEGSAKPEDIIRLAQRITELEQSNYPVGWQIMLSEERQEMAVYGSEILARAIAASDEIVRPLYTTAKPSATDGEEIRRVAVAMVVAWEKLAGAKNHTPEAIQQWLSDAMSPAINQIRTVLNLPKPK